MLSPFLTRKVFVVPPLVASDVTFEKWAEGNGLAIDVAVSPLAATYVRHKEWYAATQKHGKYDVSFAGTDYLFSCV